MLDPEFKSCSFSSDAKERLGHLHEVFLVGIKSGGNIYDAVSFHFAGDISLCHFIRMGLAGMFENQRTLRTSSTEPERRLTVHQFEEIKKSIIFANETRELDVSVGKLISQFTSRKIIILNQDAPFAEFDLDSKITERFSPFFYIGRSTLSHTEKPKN